MLGNFIRSIIHFLQEYGPGFWEGVAPYFDVPGHKPFIVLPEATVQPRGFWLTYRLPVSYYSNNTVFYHWPFDLDLWVDWFRQQGLNPQIHSVVSYKKVTTSTFLQTPYWCQYSGWDVCCFFISGSPNINSSWSLFNHIKLFSGSLYELILVYKPSYYDYNWDFWFLKTQEFDRYGVPLDQINRRLFLQSFLIGYWLYFLSDTPWPWRLHYPLDLSNWRWFRRYRYFFRVFNEVNPLLFYVSLVLLMSTTLFSDVFSYALWRVPLRELSFSGLSLWLMFIVTSVVLWLPLARFAKILYVFVVRNSKMLSLISDIIGTIFAFRRKRVLRVCQNVWHTFSLLLSLYLLFCLAPIWIWCFKFIVRLVWVFSPLLLGVFSAINAFVLYVWTWFVAHTWVLFGVGDTILGSWITEVIRPHTNYWLATGGYAYFRFRLMPGLVLFLIAYISFIIWPLLQPIVWRKLILLAPWAFVEEVPVWTRLKYGLFLFRGAVKKFWFR